MKSLTLKGKLDICYNDQTESTDVLLKDEITHKGNIYTSKIDLIQTLREYDSQDVIITIKKQRGAYDGTR